MDDLKKCIETWQTSGELLVIMGDFNEPVNGNHIHQFFSNLNLREGIHQHHPTLIPPNTFQGGSNPIDGIFISDGIILTKAGYSATDWGTQTDHRLLWIEIDTTNLFHHSDIPSWKPQARRLTLVDPRVINRFIEHRVTLTQNYNTLQSLQQIQTRLANNSITVDLASIQLNQLDHARTEHILQSDKLCRKIKIGSIPWTPDLSLCLLRIQYFRSTVKHMKEGTKIQARSLLTMRKKCQIQSVPKTLAVAQEQLSKYFKEFFKYKNNASRLRFTFLEQLAASTATHNNTPYKSTLKQIMDRESLRSSFRKINACLGQTRIGLHKVEQQDFQNQPFFITDKEGIERACM